MAAGATALSASLPTSPTALASAVRKLNSQQQAEVAQLATTDRKVRDHEAAHLAAAGPYATSGASFSYATGPDGQRYAVGGEVSLDAGPVPNDPEATIQKARVIQAAATAPVDPSSQDRAVAAQAALMEAEAERELAATSQQGYFAYQRHSPVETGQLLSALF
jgi:hypothetical protein